ncbi:uncharacterized protein LOC135218923 [Macrobrachium nipponense]|uniref:uncharacterized protein LOC135218923 n=1 Tax=Macrobrachium nipponense TaxID=159736 RepID=UPI0030C80720
MGRQQKVSDIALEFCSETSFHAIKFFTKERFSPIKRVFWILCWIASLTACIYCIAINVTEYQTTSTITTIDSTTYPVKRLSFPSATFCNFNYIMQSRNPPKQEDVLGRYSLLESPSTHLGLNSFAGKARHASREWWAGPATHPGKDGRGSPRILGWAGGARHVSRDEWAGPAMHPGTGGQGSPRVPGTGRWGLLRILGWAGEARHTYQDGRAGLATHPTKGGWARPTTRPRTCSQGLTLDPGALRARPATCPRTCGRGQPRIPGRAGEACHMSRDGRAWPATCPGMGGMGGRGPPCIPVQAGKGRHMFRDRSAGPTTRSGTGGQARHASRDGGRGLPHVSGQAGRALHASQDGRAWPSTCPGMGGRGLPLEKLAEINIYCNAGFQIYEFRREFPDSQWAEIVGAIYENLFGDEPAVTNITLGSKDIICIIKESAQKCEDMVLFCLWQGIHDCKQLFQLIPTKFGFCCVFDPLPERWNLNASHGCPREVESKGSGQQNPANKSRQDQSSVSALTDGLKRGLTVVLDAQTEDYSYSTFHSTGFQLHLQEPRQPGLPEDTIVLTPGRESFVSLSAHSTFTTPAALALRPQDRRCYRSSENDGHYTHNGCILQHQTAYILAACGCKDFHSPGPGDICYRQEQISCMTSSRDKWDADPAQQNLLDFVCLPRCNKTWYIATPSYADFPNRNLMKSWLGLRFLLPLMGKLCREGRIELHFGQERSQSNRTELSKETVDRICMITDTEELEKALTDFPDILQFLLTYIQDNVSVGHLFFGHSVSTLYKRDVVTTPSQIVANIGGLLGLFLGFSLLSGAEIVFCFFEIISSLGSSVFKRTSIVHIEGMSNQKS